MNPLCIFTTSLVPQSRQSVEITGTLLLLCLLGGAAGGLVNHLDRRQKGLIVSMVTAVTLSLPITWLYMWLAVPNLNTVFLQNRLTVVIVAMIAGAAGATGLKTAAKRFGIQVFEFATSEEVDKASTRQLPMADYSCCSGQIDERRQP